MAEINVTLSPSLESLPGRLEKALEVSHEQTGRETVNELRAGIIQAGAIASFAGLRSITKQFEERGATKAWLVGSELNYAPYAFEYGRRRGNPPPTEAIVRWIALKGLNIGGQDIRGVAFVIARAIGKRGIKPRRIFSATRDKMLPRAEEIFADNLTRTINE